MALPCLRALRGFSGDKAVSIQDGATELDDKDWRILRMIAEEKNITKAAARLFISQPALTYRLKNIEEEFGAQVVTRVPSGVVFTPQGDLLLSYVSEMLLKYDSTKDFEAVGLTSHAPADCL